MRNLSLIVFCCLFLLVFSCKSKTENLSDGKYCFAFKDEISNNTLVLNIEGNKVSGNLSGTIQDQKNAYYSSFVADFTGTKDGENLSVEVSRTVEGSVEKTSEKWVLTSNTLKIDKNTYTKLADCTTAENTTQSEGTTNNANTAAFDANSQFNWQILPSRNEAQEKILVINLEFGEKTVEVYSEVGGTPFMEIVERSEYQKLQIPDNAFTACSDNSQGSNDTKGLTVLYVVPSNATEVTVFKTHFDEGGKVIVDKQTTVKITDFK